MRTAANLHSLAHEVPGLSPGSLFDRRDLLRVGSVGFAASLAPSGLASATAQSASPPTAKSVIFLWMAGGVTHIDSFDPKPEAPTEIKGTLAAIATGHPGVHFAETLPELSRRTNLFALVRSFSHDNNDHLVSQVWTLSGRVIPSLNQTGTEPNIGSIVSYLHGPRGGLPAYIAVPGITRPGPPPFRLFVGGWLGAEHAPFLVGGEPAQPDFTVGEKSPNPSHLADEPLRPPALELLAGLDVDRLARRRQLRSLLESSLGRLERAGVVNAGAQFAGAFDLLSSSAVRDAFDLSNESAALREAYGRTKIGGRCLMARRLVEAGARFVMVDYGYDPDYGNLWDNHAVVEQKQPHISEMAKRGYHVAGIDKAFAALLSDLDGRGLLDSTLVVFLTEFGRTPRINALGGRDHWGPAGSIFFAGGGVRGGQVIGGTDKQGAYPTSPPHGPGDIAASIYRAIGIDPRTMLHDRQGRPLPVLPEGEVIPGLFA